MKPVILSLFLFLSITSYSQVPEIETSLNNAEKTLYELESDLEELKKELKEKEIRKKDSFEYIELKGDFTTQRKKVRKLRQQYKRYQKEKTNQQKKQGAATSQTASASSNQQMEVQKPVPDIALTTILFAKFSTEVSTDYKLYMNQVAKQLKENPDLLLTIDSYTDDSEKNRVSKQLSEKMAHSTAQAFVNRGISPTRLVVQSHGSKQAIADNKNYFGQARNRRVELQFIRNER